MYSTKISSLAAGALLVISQSVVASEPTVSDVLNGVAREISKSLPVKVDNEKRLDVVIAAFDTLIYKFTFFDESTIKNPRFDKNKYLAALRISLRESTCDNATFALFKRGAKYTYMFMDRSGRKLFEYTLDAKECAEFRRGSAS